MTRSSQPEGALRTVLLALEIVIALSALGGGIAMLADPSGAMGMDPSMLDRLPVDSWLLPGVALILCNAVLPSAAAAGEFRGQAWPRRFGHVLAGAVVLAWPVTETLIFGYPLAGEPVWLRPAVATVALAIIGLGLALRAQQARPQGSASGDAGTRPDVPAAR